MIQVESRNYGVYLTDSEMGESLAVNFSEIKDLVVALIAHLPEEPAKEEYIVMWNRIRDTTASPPTARRLVPVCDPCSTPVNCRRRGVCGLMKT